MVETLGIRSKENPGPICGIIIHHQTAAWSKCLYVALAYAHHVGLGMTGYKPWEFHQGWKWVPTLGIASKL